MTKSRIEELCGYVLLGAFCYLIIEGIFYVYEWISELS
jgi:hypothetical protein